VGLAPREGAPPPELRASKFASPRRVTSAALHYQMYSVSGGTARCTLAFDFRIYRRRCQGRQYRVTARHHGAAILGIDVWSAGAMQETYEGAARPGRPHTSLVVTRAAPRVGAQTGDAEGPARHTWRCLPLSAVGSCAASSAQITSDNGTPRVGYVVPRGAA